MKLQLIDEKRNDEKIIFVETRFCEKCGDYTTSLYIADKENKRFDECQTCKTRIKQELEE